MAEFGQHFRPNYMDASPYPPVKVSAPNPRYALILMDSYSGSVSEFTALSQYLYHSFVFKSDKDLVALEENIAITEMLHLEVLADLILQLGGDPVFKGYASNNSAFWSARYVYYGNNVCDQLRADLNSEYGAIRGYEDAIKQIADPYVQAVLRRIILDEKIHVTLFKNAIAKNCK